MKQHFLKNKTRGYSAIELIFYIALLAVVTVVVINAMVIMTKSFKETTVQSEVVQAASVLERMTREIRQAYDINTISATDLKLNTKDQNGNNKTIEFLLSGTDLQLLENNVLTGNLNTTSIKVTALTFTMITTTVSKAVKIAITIGSSNNQANTTQDFYNTAVLRGSY